MFKGFTKTAGRKRVETERQDSHPGIGYRQADQRVKAKGKRDEVARTIERGVLSSNR